MPATSYLTRTVLIVDDETLIRLMLSDLFEDAGFSVREAATAAEAMAILLRQESCIDLLLTDVRMPGATDGLALASWTRENCPESKVVIMSGYVGEHALQPGACDAFVRKPFDPAKLVGMATRLLQPNN